MHIFLCLTFARDLHEPMSAYLILSLHSHRTLAPHEEASLSSSVLNSLLNTGSTCPPVQQSCGEHTLRLCV